MDDFLIGFFFTMAVVVIAVVLIFQINGTVRTNARYKAQAIELCIGKSPEITDAKLACIRAVKGLDGKQQ